jgi:hypothetical protein
MRSRVVSGISLGFPGLSQSQGQVTHVLLTRSPLECPRRGLSARLACVKHAASVRPEPGSNSPSRSLTSGPRKTIRSRTSTHEKRTTLARTADTNVIRLTKGTHHDRPAGEPGGLPWTGYRFGIDNIRHAVEFSRIGRTPSPALQAVLGGNPTNLAQRPVRVKLEERSGRVRASRPRRAVEEPTGGRPRASNPHAVTFERRARGGHSHRLIKGGRRHPGQLAHPDNYQSASADELGSSDRSLATA